jgi:para-nitrobenzyl esterase
MLAMWGLPALAMAGTPLTVQVESGALRGVQDDGVASWKGIPFAAPPVGVLRWRAPQPAVSWQGLRDATAYGHDCMQVPFPSDAAPLGTPPAEDCLYANIWRPAKLGAKLPVVVWIYGGGFVNGGSSPPTYAGANLAKGGVVFASFNYRLGRFGTFAHPALARAGEDQPFSPNFATMDQIAALQWVRRNIARFGGDPANVTVIGESAGGMAIHTLLTSPRAVGLFQRAIIMSGGDGHGRPPATPASVEKIGADFGQSKGVAPDDPQALEKLRALSADTVTDGLNMTRLGKGPRSFATPFPDGTVSVEPAQAYAQGHYAHVPVIIGATSEDAGGRTGYMIKGARDLAGVLAAQGVPVWEYRFSYVAQSIGKPGASHASDIPFFLDTQTIKYGDATTPRDKAMGRAISAYILSFAKTGTPAGRGLAPWPRYMRSDDRLMDFAPDGKPHPQKDPWGAEIDAAP